MAKEVWHKIDTGSFERDNKEYKFVIEQEKNKPIDTSGKNVRMRVIQEKPVVRRVRTRYDPLVQVMGDEGAAAPAFFGYDMKRLKPSILSIFVFNYILFFTVDSLFFDTKYNTTFLDWIGSITFGPQLTMNPAVTSALMKIAVVGIVVFMLYIPFLYNFFKKWKLYKKVKKEGISYVDMHGTTGN